MGVFRNIWRHLGFNLLYALRWAALWVVALRHASTLDRFGAANARVLRTYRRVCWQQFCARARDEEADRQKRFPSSRARWHFRWRMTCAWFRVHRPMLAEIAFGRWLRLVVPMPALHRLGNGPASETLEGLLRKVKKLDAEHPPRIKCLTSPVALSLQGVIIRRVFHHRLGLSLSDDDVAVLRRCGTAYGAVHDFLQYCRGPGGLPSYEALPRFLPFFVNRVEMDYVQGQLTGWDKRKKWISLWIRWAGGLLAVWGRARATAVQSSFEQMETRERAVRDEFYRETEDRLWHGVLESAHQASLGSQGMAMIALAFETYLRTLTRLGRLNTHLKFLGHELPPGKSEVIQEPALSEAMDQLQTLFSNLLKFSKGDT